VVTAATVLSQSDVAAPGMPSFKFVDGADNAHIHSNSSPERRRYDDSSSIRASGTSTRTGRAFPDRVGAHLAPPRQARKPGRAEAGVPHRVTYA
jgi:hypothetical protein